MRPQLNRGVAIVFTIVLMASVGMAFFFDKGDVLLYVNQHENWWAARFLHSLTDLGGYLAYFMAIAVALCMKYRYAIAISINGLATLFLSGYLKSVFEQPRPALWLRGQGIDEAELFAFGTFLQPAYDSFPSGHAMAAFSLYGFCALLAKRVWAQVMWLALAVCIAFSRIYLGFHFLQDVVFGALIGIGIALLGWVFYDRYLKLKFQSENGLISLVMKRP